MVYSDFADAFQGGELKQYLAADWVMALIREARSNRHYSDSTREVARWAKEVSSLYIYTSGQTFPKSLTKLCRWSSEQPMAYRCVLPATFSSVCLLSPFLIHTLNFCYFFASAPCSFFFLPPILCYLFNVKDNPLLIVAISINPIPQS